MTGGVAGGHGAPEVPDPPVRRYPRRHRRCRWRRTRRRCARTACPPNCTDQLRADIVDGIINAGDADVGVARNDLGAEAHCPDQAADLVLTPVTLPVAQEPETLLWRPRFPTSAPVPVPPVTSASARPRLRREPKDELNSPTSSMALRSMNRLADRCARCPRRRCPEPPTDRQPARAAVPVVVGRVGVAAAVGVEVQVRGQLVAGAGLRRAARCWGRRTGRPPGRGSPGRTQRPRQRRSSQRRRSPAPSPSGSQRIALSCASVLTSIRPSSSLS